MKTTLYTCLCATLLFGSMGVYAASSQKAAPAKPTPLTPKTIACPQINDTHEYGRFFTQNGRLWHTYVKVGDQMTINTAKDASYSADPTPVAKDVMSCQSGPDGDPDYAFQAYEPKGLDCKVQDKTTFICQPAVTTTTVKAKAS